MHRIREFLHRERDTTNPPAQPQPPPQQQAQAQAPMSQPQAPMQDNVQGPHLDIAVRNDTKSNNVYCYLTGLAMDSGNRPFILRSDGRTGYMPESPSDILQPMPDDCAIKLGPPGETTTLTIPHIAGGRIWFSIDKPLVFHVNPGPAIVEPSVTNPSDSNIDTEWGFCEFTFNSDQLYGNISYVDFVGLPIALHLQTRNSGEQNVAGIAADGIDRVAQGLRAQARKDGKGWDKLIVERDGRTLRVLSPNQGMVGNGGLFENYYEGYVNDVWESFKRREISVDTQAGFGQVKGHLENDEFVMGGSRFSRPSTRDIFTCSTGPFQTGGNPETNAIIPRLAAAFNRSTALVADAFPASQDLYYKNDPTNHYSRCVHEANLDGKGYAFPYDDVLPAGGKDQSGEVHAGDPVLLTVTVGGQNAHA